MKDLLAEREEELDELGVLIEFKEEIVRQHLILMAALNSRMEVLLNEE